MSGEGGAISSGGDLLLEMSGIEKSFPGVQALRCGQLALRAGEVHALVGENGAGKSTLIKILSGAHQPDAGTIRIDGRDVRISSPLEGRTLGISVIHQEFNLVPAQTVAENLFLGREITRFGLTVEREELARASSVFARLGVQFDPSRRCRDLSVAEQQLVEIAKAAAFNARILVMDEPTAALSDREVQRLFELIRDLRRQGVSILYVSHRLEEIFELCDRVTVMRDGEHVATRTIQEFTREKLIELMVGRKLEAEFPKRDGRPGSVRLDIRNLKRTGVVHDVSFQLKGGEILGLAGLVGAGRTETARLIFGADPMDGGDVTLDGRRLSIDSPQSAIAAGICLLTEDRKQQGLVLGHSLLDNFLIPSLDRFSRFGFVQQHSVLERFLYFVSVLNIRLSSPGQPARGLSGGNQQKLVLAKWLQTESEVVIFDEPTRGVDVGAKVEIYQLINRLADDGKCVLMISSELPELLGLCDRILVMRHGEISGEILDVRQAAQQDVLSLAMD